MKEEKEGEGMLLYHATCFPPESFTKGIDATRAKGFGQGEGFYFYTNKNRALRHGKEALAGEFDKEESCPEDATTAYIIVSDEPVTPETFDVDYEVYVEGFAKFMIDNLQFFFKNMEAFGIAPPRVSSRKTPQDFFMKFPHTFKVPADETGTIRLGYLARGSDTDTYKAASISRIAGKLAEVSPEMFREFEKQFLSKASAIKYNGKEKLIPLRVEDLEGNVVWSR
tara:strand:- start:2 stop:676 length:675 start_codon:yes stop_codon:yes gene_type:complete